MKGIVIPPKKKKKISCYFTHPQTIQDVGVFLSDLQYMNHQGTRFQLKIFFTFLLKKKRHLDVGWADGE